MIASILFDFIIEIKQLIKFNYNESIFLNNLRNKKYVRKNSINSKKISLKTHDLWFRNFLMNKNKIIISTGGGLIIKNLQQLRLSFNIYLYCDLEVLTQRASRNNLRPLLNEDTSLQMKNLFNERKEIYKSAADITINATDNPKSTINEIIKEISNDN